MSERPSSSILLAMQNCAQPKEPYHEFSIITAQEVAPESKQKENSKATSLNSDMKDDRSEHEEKQSCEEWTCDKVHCEDSLQDERHSADTLKGLLLE